MVQLAHTVHSPIELSAVFTKVDGITYANGEHLIILTHPYQSMQVP